MVQNSVKKNGFSFNIVSGADLLGRICDKQCQTRSHGADKHCRMLVENGLSEELSGAPDALFDFHTGGVRAGHERDAPPRDPEEGQVEPRGRLRPHVFRVARLGEEAAAGPRGRVERLEPNDADAPTTRSLMFPSPRHP